jgi:hypothetical protein
LIASIWREAWPKPCPEMWKQTADTARE